MRPLFNISNVWIERTLRQHIIILNPMVLLEELSATVTPDTDLKLRLGGSFTSGNR